MPTILIFLDLHFLDSRHVLSILDGANSLQPALASLDFSPVRLLPLNSATSFSLKRPPSNVGGELTVFIARSDSDSFGIIESSSPLSTMWS